MTDITQNELLNKVTTTETTANNALKNTATGNSNPLTIFGNPSPKNGGVNIGYDSSCTDNYSVVVGRSATGSYRTAVLGYNTKAQGRWSVCIGHAANTTTDGFRATCLGTEATASATGAIQIGKGSNSVAGTLNVGLTSDGSTFSNYQLLNSVGNIPVERLKELTLSDLATAGSGISFSPADIQNFNIIGNPTITNKVVSNFSIENYLKPTFSSFISANSWEICFKVTTGNDVSERQQIFQYTAGLTQPTRYSLNFWACPHFGFNTTYDGTSFDVEVNGTYTLLPNTAYWIKMGWTGTEYYLKYSLNGTDYIDDASIQSSTPTYSGLQYPYIGCYVCAWDESVNNDWPWGGSIDLSECSIKANNIIIWTPYESTQSISVSADQVYNALSTNAQSGIAVKSAIDNAISTVYKAAGSVAFASLPTLSSSYEGYVYNVSDAFTTTSDFVEGSGKSYPAGTNVVCINTGSSTYKWDVLAGFVDLSSYVQNAATGTSAIAMGGSSQGTNTKSVALGYDARSNSNGGVAIGPHVYVYGTNGTAVGYGAYASGNESLALGTGAIAYYNNAIQIGQGTNSEASTLKIGLAWDKNYKLLDSDGKIPAARLPETTILVEDYTV